MLSIVVELDIATIFGADVGPLFAVVGETMIAGPISVRLERFGRPLMKSVVPWLKRLRHRQPRLGYSRSVATRRTHSSWGRHTLVRIERG